VIVWLDGQLVALDDARVSPLDHGLLVGDGVFETLRVYAGRPFAWRRHIARLQTSAAALGLSAPDDAALRAAADAVLEANDCPEARLRITVTSGAAPPGSSRRGSAGPTVFLVAFPLDVPGRAAAVVVVPWTRNENGALAGLKTISYAANARALTYAEERGAIEGIFANTRGNLCEATGSNVFCVVDGVVVTPPASAGCLLGVTRGLVLELCESLGIPSAEQDLSIENFRTVREAFLSSTTREVQAIATIDGSPVADAPGAVTAKLAHAFRDLVNNNLDP
jgi:branched-chain amino acid aminotransferase